MGVKFDNTLVTNYGRAQTVENAFKVFGNWSSIHDFNFDADIETNSFTLLRNGVNSWANYSIFPTDVASDVYIEFDVDNSQDVGDGFGIVCMWDDENKAGYLVGIDNTGKSFLASYNGSVATMICKRPTPFTVSHGHFEFAARQQYYSTNENDLWLSFSLWVNGALIDTWAVYKGSPIDYVTSVGFAHYGTNSEFTITNVRVPQLSGFVEWNSIDTGENPIGGLQRVIEGRYLKFFVRYDGSLRAWRSHPTDSLRTFYDEEDVYTNAYKLDKRKLYNHVRVLGAFVEAEYISAPILNMGHRFTEVNNPYLMTVSECFDEGKNHVRRMIEESVSASISTPFSPLLENEDRITTSLGEHIITAREWKFNGAGQIVDQQLSMRKYGFPSNSYIYYVDSVLGDDENSGTRAAPFKTLSALPTEFEGMVVYLARGSTFTESVALPVDNIKILTYGVGAKPVFECSKVQAMTASTKTGGYTNIYEISITNNNVNSDSWQSVWENDIRMERAADLTACDATPNSYFVDSDTSSTFTLYLHTSDSADPKVNGKVYDLSWYSGIDLSGSSNGSIKNVVINRSMSRRGALQLGRSCSADGIIIAEGNERGLTLKEGCSFTNFSITNLYKDDNVYGVYYEDDDTDALGLLLDNGIISNTTSLNAPSSAALAGTVTTSGSIGFITASYLAIEGYLYFSDAEDFLTATFDNCVYDGDIDGVPTGLGVRLGYAALLTLVACDMFNMKSIAFTAIDDTYLEIIDSTFDFSTNMTGAGIYIQHNSDLSLEGNIYTQSASGTNQYAIASVGAITVNVYQELSTFFGGSTYFWNFDSASTVVLGSRENCLDADCFFTIGGVNFTNLADAQAASHEPDTSIGGC